MDLWVVKYATVGPGSGIFPAIHRSEAPGSGAFWPLRQVQGKGARLRELPDGRGVRGRDQALWSRSNDRAGDRGGARADKPRWVSNRVCCQANVGFQGVLDLSMAFMMLSSLCMQATITTLAGFPAALRR